MKKIGLALSGGGVRGVAHIGVIKALNENGIFPDVIAGVSAGSLIGAGIASGMSWQQLSEMAYSTIFWPKLLNSSALDSLCKKYFPEFFTQFKLPFAAVATSIPERKTITFTEGKVAPAISASCAIPFLRRPVTHNGYLLVDGGVTCIIPSVACRELGADFVISSDVWEYSSLLRTLGFNPTIPEHNRWYPKNYLRAILNTDLFIQPNISPMCYIPIKLAIDHLISAGQSVTTAAIKTNECPLA